MVKQIMRDWCLFSLALCLQRIKKHVRNKVMYGLPWTLFGHWRSNSPIIFTRDCHSWKLLVNCLIHDWKNVIHSIPCIILCNIISYTGWAHPQNYPCISKNLCQGSKKPFSSTYWICCAWLNCCSWSDCLPHNPWQMAMEYGHRGILIILLSEQIWRLFSNAFS